MIAILAPMVSENRARWANYLWESPCAILGKEFADHSVALGSLILQS
jgi:hypothetical protein